jgi:exosortase A-associated hydrolase 2
MPAFEALYTEAGPAGRLLVVHHPVWEGRRHCVVVVPAFAEEMNKSRRQVALLARALRTAGIGTLIVDLTGTGDSDGELTDASVTRWCDDLDLSIALAREQGYAAVSLLALRAGALLSCAWLARGRAALHRLVWWQPVMNGKLMINQFLRLKAAAGMLTGGAGESVASLREQLTAGRTVEVAGYALTPRLVADLEALDLAQARDAGRIDWLQIGAAGADRSPAQQRAVAALEGAGVDVHWQSVDGEPFWSTAEIATAPLAIEATVRLLGSDA